MAANATRGVELPEGRTGSAFLHDLLVHAADGWPDVFRAVSLPRDAKAFRDRFGDVLPHFEAARAASEQRVDIAMAMRKHAAKQLRFVDAAGARSFAEAMSEAAEPVPLRVVPTRGPGRLRPVVTIDGARYAGAELIAWLAQAHARHWLTAPVVERLQRLIDRAGADGLSLRGERFALMGAGAELSPAPLLLAAGADVLWMDIRDPSDALLSRDDLGGTLFIPERPSNLLMSPQAICATIARFAADGPVHIGMYAYAGGESQEWRLTASMNGILRTLPPNAARSMSVLISPTTVSVAQPEDVAAAQARVAAAPAWKRALAKAGVLRRGGVPCGDGRVPCAVVPLQGASYQAAQYIGKVLSAETHAVHGADLASAPLTVSANTAPITNTRSLAHPVFQAGFLFAPAWGLWIAPPDATRSLNGLLAIADVIDPEAPGAAGRSWPSPAAKARALFTEQIHGGLFAQPWAADGEIRVAAVMGMAKRPSLLVAALRGG